MHDGDMGVEDDFYETDEPVEKVLAVFERGEKRRTVAPGRGWTVNFYLPGPQLIDHLIVKETTDASLRAAA